MMEIPGRNGRCFKPEIRKFEGFVDEGLKVIFNLRPTPYSVLPKRHLPWLHFRHPKCSSVILRSVIRSSSSIVGRLIIVVTSKMFVIRYTKIQKQ